MSESRQSVFGRTVATSRDPIIGMRTFAAAYTDDRFLRATALVLNGSTWLTEMLRARDEKLKHFGFGLEAVIRCAAHERLLCGQSRQSCVRR